ncbi:MAG: thioredoxin domain-containing protein [Acidobacteria bacterium]|nr:thioredoxin domain-containing protein [Acidobacteriota bacterium]
MSIIRRVAGLAIVVLLAASLLPAQKPASKSAEELRPQCLGNPNAAVSIEVFSDHQCPACRQLYLETMRSVLADYGMPGKVCLTYYEFPLRAHKYSRDAARYSQAASRLGPMQWIQVADALYYYQPQWSESGEIEPVVAKALSEKDMSQVRQWLKDPKLEAAIERDLNEGTRRAVRSTPTIFVTANGSTERFTGVLQYPIFRRYLDNLLTR